MSYQRDFCTLWYLQWAMKVDVQMLFFTTLLEVLLSVVCLNFLCHLVPLNMFLTQILSQRNLFNPWVISIFFCSLYNFCLPMGNKLLTFPKFRCLTHIFINMIIYQLYFFCFFSAHSVIKLIYSISKLITYQYVWALDRSHTYCVKKTQETNFQKALLKIKIDKKGNGWPGLSATGLVFLEMCLWFQMAFMVVSLSGNILPESADKMHKYGI